MVKTRKYNEERMTKNLKIAYYIPSTFRGDYQENSYNITKVSQRMKKRNVHFLDWAWDREPPYKKTAGNMWDPEVDQG